MTLRAAVDIGGTFTDLVLFDDASGELRVGKAPSSAADPVSAVLQVVEKADVTPAAIEHFIHGTTVVTNALLERRGARVALITNRGFRDVIFVREANRRDLYSLTWRKPLPLAERADCLELGCRIDSDGKVRTEPDDVEIGALADHLERERIAAVAICFLFAYVNPVHERYVAERLGERLPELTVSLSHQVFPRWREADRALATIADASVRPMFSRYTRNLQDGLAGAGSPARLLVMKSNGGVVDGEVAAERSTNYLVSGPVGGALAAAHFAARAGFDRVMTMDIGGTSCDVALLEDARPRWSGGLELDFGLTIRAPMLDIRTIGAGGGSIAHLDDGGLLRVGPRSASADPGPACYGRGGTEPTLTDANLILGRLDAARFLDGEVALDPELSHAALAPIAAGLGMEIEDAALAVVRVAGSAMAQALRAISVERGVDPRELGLVAFGGAGGLHACDIAREVGTPTVLVPPYPGNTSAMGLLTAGLRSDAATTLLIRSDAADLASQINTALAPLRDRVVEALAREGGTHEPTLRQHLEIRYYGQNYHREIELASSFPLTPDDLWAAVQAFHDDYERQYGYAQRDELVEVVGANVAALVEGPKPRLELSYANAAGGPRAAVTRQVYFERLGWCATRLWDRSECRPGTVIEGPAIVQEGLSTTLIPPSWVLTVLSDGTLSTTLGSEG